MTSNKNTCLKKTGNRHNKMYILKHEWSAKQNKCLNEREGRQRRNMMKTYMKKIWNNLKLKWLRYV